MKDSLARPLWLLACCAAAGMLPLQLCSGNPLVDFARLRAGPTVGRGYTWHYKGVLSDPTTGRRLASVEGLERTELASCSADRASYWSRKAFAYTSRGPLPRPSLLDRILLWGRNTSQSISAPTSTRAMEELITLGATAGPTGGLFSRIQLTGQRSAPRTKIDVAASSPSAEYTPRILDISHIAVSDDSPARPTRLGRSLSPWLTVASPLSRDAPRARSQEQYTVVHTESRFSRVKNSVYNKLGYSAAPDVVLQYRRHGEAPPWTGAHGVCLTELTAWRYGDGQIALPRATLARFDKQLSGYVNDLFGVGRASNS